MSCATDPLSAARHLRAAGERVALLYAGAPGPFPARSLLATRPDDEILTAPGSGAGLPAIPPRLVHTAHGQGLWAGAIAYDAGLGLLGIPSRHDPVVPAFAATYHAHLRGLRPRRRRLGRGRAATAPARDAARRRDRRPARCRQPAGAPRRADGDELGRPRPSTPSCATR